MLRCRHVPVFSPRVFRRSFSQSPAVSQLSPFTRRLFKLPIPPRPASQAHDDLPSFLAYSKRTDLPTTSTTYVGTHYEYTVLQSLRRFAFTLHRVGGRDDAGIDLVGTWHLPDRESALRVIVQCKALKSRLGPNLVRELEGTFRNSPVGWRTNDKLGILVSPREATKGVRDAMARSGYPLLWMMMEQDGVVRQALWNAKAEEQLGLVPLGVETRYRGGESSQPMQKEMVLTWNGEELPDMDQVEEKMAELEAKWLALWNAQDLSETGKVELLDTLEATSPELAQCGGLLRGMEGAEEASDSTQRLSETDKAELLAKVKARRLVLDQQKKSPLEQTERSKDTST
ncbi:hypothetical protein VTN00DRAFT_6808 [Thermoascus crustaceus]|uniref:uncharacterized protein n=1 Tax=Thermoascus crustaceus TaxID=5088 RepID=UPI0037438988